MKHDQRIPPSQRLDDADIAFLAGLMDDRFNIPGTNIRFGLDAVIGLIPGVGDAIGGVISSYIIWRAQRMGASKLLLIRMAGNMLVDSTLGVIPVFGDIFDWRFKSNRRNLELLRKHRHKFTPPVNGIRPAASGMMNDGAVPH